VIAAGDAPPTRHVTSRGVDIAYQVVGGGKHDVVFVPGLLSHIGLWWEQPAFAQTFARVGSLARLIIYDRRGSGLSGGDALPTMDERLADLAAVMDAAGSRRAVIFGPSDGAATAAVFAATYPERCAALALYGAQATGIRDDDYPWGVAADELELMLRSVEYDWGNGGTLGLQAPTLAADDAMRDWWSRVEREGIRQAQVVPALRAMAHIDIRDVLPAIAVPTMVAHCAGDLVMPIEGARYLADHIPGARFVELPGHDHLAVFANAEAMVSTLSGLLDDLGAAEPPAERLATVVVGQPPGGRAVAAFDGPCAAVSYARALRDAGDGTGVAVHTGPCRTGSAPAGEGVDVAAALVGAARGAEVLVSRSTRNLLAGTPVDLERWGSFSRGAGDDTQALPVYALA
jgi:pimeloyl-ACP methyl ester carboxylesterase